ncbi:MAG: LamG-like jellyroll fold domain-containing protein [Saprospiraceae bacterium]
MSATDVRNPKVVFGLPGTYTATLTVNGSYSNSMTIKVNEGCRVDTVPGSTVTLQGNDFGDYVAIPSFGLSTNTITITAWIKPDGIQPDYSCIFMTWQFCGFNFLPGSNHLGYHWPGGAWWWDSGLTVPDGVWSHVAMVVEPSGITLYLNGRPSKHGFATQVVDFDSGGRLGNYKGWGGRYMKGTIDEVSVFNKSLTQAEIRELMHLTKDPSERPDLLVYYQFNEASGLVLDKVGVRHGSLVGPTIKRERSTAPVGKGISQRMQVLSGKKRFILKKPALCWNSALPVLIQTEK